MASCSPSWRSDTALLPIEVSQPEECETKAPCGASDEPLLSADAQAEGKVADRPGLQVTPGLFQAKSNSGETFLYAGGS